MNWKNRAEWIGLAGVFIGALIVGGANWATNSQRLDFERDSRSFEMRLAIYSRFDNLSLKIMNDFLVRRPADPNKTFEFNEVFSKIGLLGSKPVRDAASVVHLIIARLKVADPSELKKLLDADYFTAARAKFKVAVKREMWLPN